MKELLTLREAASLAGRTTKTIKNYIKQGKITNYFLVDGKYGQEYRINVKDIEPLVKRGKTNTRTQGLLAGENRRNLKDIKDFDCDNIAPEDIYNRHEYQFLLRRNEDMLMKVGRYRERLERLESTLMKLRQELEEKNMLIEMLTKKKPES
jgi:predicted site-specific integrase-resolvase